MATNNAVNLTQAGVVSYNGSGAFTGSVITNHNALVAGASNSITSVAPSATSGVPFISQGAAADPVFGTAVVAGGGTGAVTLTGVLTGNGTSAITANAVTQHNVLIAGAANAVSSITPSTAGFILTSNGAASDPSFQAPTATVFPWTDVTGTTQTIAINNGYTANNGALVTFTLPATAAYGSIIRVAGKGAGGWTIHQNASQQILIGTGSTTSGTGGSLSSTNANDAVELLASTGGSSTIWTALSYIGNLTTV